MNFTRVFLSIVFALSASAALAAKPDKTLVCHVGNQLGSMGESYQDNRSNGVTDEANPHCKIMSGYEGDPADYICPDAGKIDLILVSEKAVAKHIAEEGEEPLHYFDGWEDYAPEDGVGDDPADFEEGDLAGIDKGCELAVETGCPCVDGPPYKAYHEATAFFLDPFAGLLSFEGDDVSPGMFDRDYVYECSRSDGPFGEDYISCGFWPLRGEASYCRGEDGNDYHIPPLTHPNPEDAGLLTSVDEYTGRLRSCQFVMDIQVGVIYELWSVREAVGEEGTPGYQRGGCGGTAEGQELFEGFSVAGITDAEAQACIQQSLPSYTPPD